MMRIIGKACIVLVGVVLVGSSSVAAQQSGAGKAKPEADVKTQISKSNEAFAAAVSKKDAAAIAKLYASDAQLCPPNSDIVRGSEGIQKFWQGVLDSGVTSVKLQTTEVRGLGTMAHEIGTYSLTGADGKETDRGKYVVIWKQEGKGLKMYCDMWNTSMPATQQ